MVSLVRYKCMSVISLQFTVVTVTSCWEAREIVSYTDKQVSVKLACTYVHVCTYGRAITLFYVKGLN